MTPSEQILMEIKATIFDLSADDQKKVQDAIVELRAVLENYKEGHAHLAMAYIGAQIDCRN